MPKKKKIIAVAFVVWLLVAIFLAAKTLDDLRGGYKQPVGDPLTLEQILFPSRRMGDQE
jgi:hypothetical protein